ncbi:MAG: alpha/beta fold hydrolase [Pirellulales bacterium]
MLRLAIFICTFVCVMSEASLAVAQLPTARPTSIWYGEMDAGPRVFRFVVFAVPSPSGEWNAELVSLDEGESKFHLSKFTIDERAMHFELMQTKATYSGIADSVDEPSRSDHAQTLIKGKWNQNGASIDLDFKQVDMPPQDKPNEVWVGDLKAGFQTLKLQFRVYDDNGTDRVLMDSLTQKTGGFKASRKVDGDTVEFHVAALRGQFKGKKVRDQTLEGTWTQGIAFGLKLDRIAAPQRPTTVETKRPQTPKPPFPYESEEVQFENGEAGIRLAGTLTIPKSQEEAKRFAAAILVTGSGPQDRDETLLGHKPFFVLADYLTRRGIAVLRYDDRGVGGSTGDFAKATTADFAADAAAAVEFLRRHARIDPSQVGIIGHSEGGIVAPMVAVAKPEIAWIVLMAGTGVNGEQIIYSQGKLIAKTEGADEDALVRQRLLQETIFEAVKNSQSLTGVESLVEPTTARFLERLKEVDQVSGKSKSVEDEATFKGLVSMQVKANLIAMNSPWFRYFAEHEPQPVLEKVHCPVLALNGSKDVQVDPKLNLVKIEAALKSGGNKDFKITELPGLNHLFQTSATGAVSQYESIEETISDVALQTMGDWIMVHIH